MINECLRSTVQGIPAVQLSSSEALKTYRRITCRDRAETNTCEALNAL